MKDRSLEAGLNAVEAKTPMDSPVIGRALIVRVGNRLVAIPLQQVVEVMRPLPAQALTAMPPAILGLATIRGHPIPVVELSCIVTGHAASRISRYVLLRTGANNARQAALAVERIEGISELGSAHLAEMPPLFSASHAETVSALGTLDAQLLLVLHASRFVPEDVWKQLDQSISQ
jgi:purine-binding chemotaxis protein CheW